jgi:hypothetical protein
MKEPINLISEINTLCTINITNYQNLNDDEPIGYTSYLSERWQQKSNF